MNKKEIIDKIISIGLKEKNLTKDKFYKLKNQIYKDYKLKKPFPNIEIIKRYNELVEERKINDSNIFRKIIRKRAIRSLSGITVISLLTKPFDCPGKCIYCPNFKNLPKSYIPNEPAVQRAELNNFDPILQIHNRLRALEITGHKINKNDVRIIGGTWSYYDKDYKEKFIKGIYDAFNTYYEMKNFIEDTSLSNEKFAIFKLKEGYRLKLSKSLEEAKKINETSKCRVIGIAIETRPDLINEKEIKNLRKYGITRVEIGYQTTIDKINKLNKRGHSNKESIKATSLLKDAGFKVVAHIMPNLLGSNIELDKKSFKEIFENQNFRPDELKIYPMVVTDNSELTKIWKKGGFIPYDDKTLINLIAALQEMIPEYVRLNRTYRDIPASEILAGSHLSNLRQLVEEKLQKKGIKLLDTRYRELKNKNNDTKNAKLNIFEYEANNGKEFFLTFEDKFDRTIFSLLRLRFPSRKNKKIYEYLPEIIGSSLIREIHTFGDQLNIGESGSGVGQHIGFGKKLIKKAEEISRKNGYKKISVIAGIGVREYYKKRGYFLKGEYMVKKL